MDTCRHVTKVRPATDHSILNPQKWHCFVCGTTESVWACLSCSHVACGRFIEEHAVKHFRETKHPLSLEVNEKYVYCYECDDYVLNDNAAGDIKILRSCLSAVATQSFHQVEGLKSHRLLRSYSFHGLDSKQQEKLDREEDRSYTALRFRRYYLLGRVFSAWKQFAHSSKKAEAKPESVAVDVQTAVVKPELPAISGRVTRRAFFPGVTGLRNLGNTCYMNAILQVLSHLDELRDYFLSLKETDTSSGSVVHSQDKPLSAISAKNFYTRQTTMECFKHVSADTPKMLLNKKGGLNGGGTSASKMSPKFPNSKDSDNVTLSQELHALLRVMWSGKWALVSPHKMLFAVWAVIPFFKGYAQQDAQEFLCEFLDKVQSELSRMEAANASSLSKTPVNQQTRALDIVDRTFQGELISEVTCLSCGHKSKTKEPFMDLSLEFPVRYQAKAAGSNSCHVEEMLSKFTAVEKLEGKIYACEMCNKKRRRSSTGSTVYSEAEKRFTISGLPQVLRLHLKRFMWSGRNNRGKISVHVNFDDELYVNPFCHADCASESYAYQLSAVVMHHGRGFGSGHYTAYCWNNETGSWLHCNDSKMERCQIKEVMRAQAYILVYTRKPCDVMDADLPASLESAVGFEEEADDEVTFNYWNSTIPRFMALKRQISHDTESREKLDMKRRKSTLW